MCVKFRTLGVGNAKFLTRHISESLWMWDQDLVSKEKVKQEIKHFNILIQGKDVEII